MEVRLLGPMECVAADPGLVADSVARALGLHPVAVHGDEEGPDAVGLIIGHLAATRGC